MPSVRYCYPFHLLSLHTTTDNPSCEPRVGYAITPSRNRERGREARLHILAEQLHWASMRFVCAWKAGYL